MKRKSFVLVSILSLVVANAIAQVSLQTGAAQFGVPLYSFTDPANRLSLTAALNYVDGNGLKVNEVASEVGTGWILDCGGFIARIQHGEPDDQKQNEAFNYPDGTQVAESDYLHYVDSYYPNGFLYSEYPAGPGINNAAAYTPLLNCLFQYKPRPEYIADREQDVFVFNFNGKQGQFVIGKNMQVKSLVQNNLKIDFITTDLTSSNIRTRINSFTITDENGIRYVFEEKQLDEICSYDRMLRYDKTNGTPLMLNGQINEYLIPNTSYCVPGGDVATSQYRVFKGRARGRYVVNKWLLTEISNPLTRKKITFNYDTYDVDYDSEVSAALTNADNHEQVAITIGRVKSKAKRLSRVILTGSQSLEFIYSTTDRVDLANGRALTGIAVKYKDNIVNGWDFTYGYFTNYGSKNFTDAFADNEKPYARLCLQKLQRYGKSNMHDQPYIFNYFLGDPNIGQESSIPGRFSFFQDHWGYANYKQWGNYTFVFNAYGSEPPPGGLNYYYEYFFKNALKNFPALKNPYNQEAKYGILKSVQYPLGGSITYDYEQNTAWYNNQNNAAGGVRVSKTTENNGEAGHDIVREYHYTKEDGQSSSGWGLEPLTYSTTSNITIDRCDNTPKTAGFTVRDIGAMFINNVVTLAGGGTTMLGGLFAVSGATLEAAAVSTVTGLVIAAVVYIIIDYFSEDQKSFSTTSWYNFAMESSNLLALQYSRVEVVNKLVNSDVGKTVYEFTDENFQPVDIPVLPAPYSSKQRYAHWLYGLPRKVTIWDNTGTPVKKSEYDYIKSAAAFTDNNFLSRKWMPVNTYYGCLPYIQFGTSNTSTAQEVYYPFTGKAQLQQTREYLYKNASEYNVVTTNYEYNSKELLSKKSGNNSKGELVETIYHYPFEYTAAGAIQAMNDVNNNIVAPVISTESYITKTGGQKYLLSGSSTEFYIASNGDIKPWKSYSVQSDQPVLNSSLAAFNPGQVVRDANYFKVNNVFYYNNNGQLSEMMSEGNKKSTTIYDDDGQNAIASVTNAAASMVAFTSFESNAAGGWMFPADAVTTTAYLTGKAGYSFTASRFTTIEKETGAWEDKALKVSFWARGNAPYVFNASISSGPIAPSYTYNNTATGWTYYEYSITGKKVIVANAASGGPNGNFIIDELRLYPASSRMISYTCDPLIGKTSECDQANHITYYRYDDLGRLTGVLDQDKNLIKAYEYNYKQ